jgi:hypothetical protein
VYLWFRTKELRPVFQKVEQEISKMGNNKEDKYNNYEVSSR